MLLHARPRDVGALPGIARQTVHVQVRANPNPHPNPNPNPNPDPDPNPNPNPNPNQDAAQQYGPSLLRPLRPGTLVLDACAAPGGKLRALLRHQPLVRSLGGGLGFGLWCACSRRKRA